MVHKVGSRDRMNDCILEFPLNFSPQKYTRQQNLMVLEGLFQTSILACSEDVCSWFQALLRLPLSPLDKE